MNPFKIVGNVIYYALGTTYVVGLGLMASRVAVELKHKYDKRRAAKKPAKPDSIEDQLDIAIHTREIEEGVTP